MKAIVVLNQVTANKVAGDLSAQWGYPKAGVDVGGGLHAPPGSTVTLRYAAPFKHPTLTTWAVPVADKDAADAKLLAVVAANLTAAPVTLDATWNAADPLLVKP